MSPKFPSFLRGELLVSGSLNFRGHGGDSFLEEDSWRDLVPPDSKVSRKFLGELFVEPVCREGKADFSDFKTIKH